MLRIISKDLCRSLVFPQKLIPAHKSKKLKGVTKIFEHIAGKCGFWGDRKEGGLLRRPSDHGYSLACAHPPRRSVSVHSDLADVAQQTKSLTAAWRCLLVFSRGITGMLIEKSRY